MRLLRRPLMLLFAILTPPLIAAHAQTLAPAPPMGWNSWDAYGLTISEADFKANALVLASMKEYGWQYAVIDEGWYMEDPFAGTPAKQKFVFDRNGRLIPALNRFPDAANGAGLKPLADWVHQLGLKFGIHLIRGIPRQSVDANLPIAGSKFTAAEAGDTSDVCPWDQGNYGVRDNAAGQAWYDSMIALYASWGVDFLKVDCISDHTYKASEIRQIAEAIKKTGLPIVLSLSPGPTALAHQDVVSTYAQMWRISDDHWDVWSDDKKSKGGTGEFPFSTRDAFDRLAAWNKYVRPGKWPDEDMLPFGSLTPHPGWQDARESRLTHDEERTEFTLWAIARSPLILGANLTKLDAFTKKLITNQDLINMNQRSWSSEPIQDLPAGFENVKAWHAMMRDRAVVPVPGTMSSGGATKPAEYFAFFNVGDQQVDLHPTWYQLGLKDGTSRPLVKNIDASSFARTNRSLDISLPPHGSAVFVMVFPKPIAVR